MRERTAVGISMAALVISTLLIPENDYRGMVLQSILCGVLALAVITSLRSETESAIFAGSLIASLTALALLIGAPLFDQARSFEAFLAHELGVVAGAVVAAMAGSYLPGRGETGHG